MFDTRLYEAHIPLPLPTLHLLQIPISLPSPSLNLPPFSFSFSLHKQKIDIFSLDFPNLITQNQNMAQNKEKEETEFKVPETITPCVNNCGVTGNPATNNMCQNCFNATTTTTTSSSTSSGAGISAPSKFVDDSISRSTTSRSPKRSYPSDEPTSNPTGDRPNPEESTPSEAKRVVNRCSGCRRKVGLTGFRCRCGELFCADHRYSDRHDCSYDYKAAGREAIARENPVIKAAKIVKV